MVAVVVAALDVAETRAGVEMGKEAEAERPAAVVWVELGEHRRHKSDSDTTCTANRPTPAYTSVCSQQSLHRLLRCHVMNDR